jgi:polyferredoxin
MDACDDVMLKLHRAPELIRIDSQAGVHDGKRFRFTRRVMAYTAVLALLIGLEGFLFIRRSDLEMTVLRVPGLLFQKQPDGRISNLYNVQFVNKTFSAKDLHLASPLPGAEIKLVGGAMHAKAAASSDAVFFIILPTSQAKGAKFKVPIDVYAGKELVASTQTTFFSPGQ